MPVTPRRPVPAGLLAGLALAPVLALSGPLAAQGTAAQRAACTPDVLRLCSADIPDVPRSRACLAREHARGSADCRGARGADVAATGSLGKRQERHQDRQTAR